MSKLVFSVPVEDLNVSNLVLHNTKYVWKGFGLVGFESHSLLVARVKLGVNQL